MIFKYSLLLMVLFSILKLKAQEDTELGTRIILNANSFSDATYYEYQPPFKATAIYGNLEEVTNEYVEQLMSSVLCASSQEWENYNTLGGQEKAEKKSDVEFKQIKKEREKNLFELHSKLTFRANGSEMAIIKFYLINENTVNPIAGGLVMEKVNKRWYITSTPYTTDLAIILTNFKADVFGRIISNQPKNKMEENICNKVLTDNGLNINEILEYNYTENEKDYLTNPLNW